MTQSARKTERTRFAFLLVASAVAAWIITLPQFHSPVRSRLVDMLVTTSIFVCAGLCFSLSKQAHRAAVVIAVVLGSNLLFTYAPLIARHYVNLLIGLFVCAIFSGLPVPTGSRTMAESWRVVRNHPDDERIRFAAFAATRRLFSRLDQRNK
jgi:hypothetical protein